ncbi:hypothetical protein NXS19_013712 [Fusarium pseudograminearum]|nr:hypothetical protein NXS19_013712 [Fusarium pseudograminearum]
MTTGITTGSTPERSAQSNTRSLPVGAETEKHNTQSPVRCLLNPSLLLLCHITTSNYPLPLVYWYHPSQGLSHHRAPGVEHPEIRHDDKFLICVCICISGCPWRRTAEPFRVVGSGPGNGPAYQEILIVAVLELTAAEIQQLLKRASIARPFDRVKMKKCVQTAQLGTLHD